MLEQQENDENESEGGELLEVWYGELWDVNIGEGFEEGEFGFALMGFTNDDDIIHCQIHTNMTYVEASPECGDCILSFTVEIGEPILEDEWEPCASKAQEPNIRNSDQYRYGRLS